MAGYIELSPHAVQNQLINHQVRVSLMMRPYQHWIKVMGYKKGRGIAFGYMSVVTNQEVAQAEGYYSPQEWVTIQDNLKKGNKK